MDLTLYTTEYCQLCEEATALIYRVLEGCDYQLSFVDVSDTDHLMECYGTRIPVLAFNEAESQELDWPFDARQLLSFLKIRE